MFSIYSSGGNVVHSAGRLIPHEFPITDLQQISDKFGRFGKITCNVSSGTAMFNSTTGALEFGGVEQYPIGSFVTLIVFFNSTDSFQNRDMYCPDVKTNHFYLYIMSSNANSCELFIVFPTEFDSIIFQLYPVCVHSTEHIQNSSSKHCQHSRLSKC